MRYFVLWFVLSCAGCFAAGWFMDSLDAEIDTKLYNSGMHIGCINGALEVMLLTKQRDLDIYHLAIANCKAKQRR